MVKMIVGLGNPGQKYHETKHNIGFMTIDKIAQDLGIHFSYNKIFQADIATAVIEGEKVYFVKPTTFMNESGKSVGPLLTYYGLSLSDLVVIYDDLDMIVGKIRYRLTGSSGGHNGIKSLIHHLHSQDFARFKVGIGRPPKGQTVISHVLSPFINEDKITIDESLDKVYTGVKMILQGCDSDEISRKCQNG